MKFNYLKYDLKASLVVFLVALPLCLGIALASNAPLVSGLLAGIVGGLIVGAFSDSCISVSGPAAGLTVIVASAVSELGNFQSFTLAVFIAGLMQVAFGVARGGIIGNYFPNSVIKGMLAAIGLILILKQVPHAVGYDADFMGDEGFFQVDGQNTFSQLLMAINATHPGAIFISLLSFATMILWERSAARGNRFFQALPGPLFAVVISILLSLFFIRFFPLFVLDERHLVQLPLYEGFGDFFRSFTFPSWGMLNELRIYKVAFVIAIVASIESLLSIDAADKLDDDGRITSKNQELIAQGLGNSLSGLIGGLPLTAVIVRTSANASAGAKTKISAILHGVWLVLCIIFIPRVLNLIPLASLAAMLILVGYKLAKPELFKKMYAKGASQFVPFCVTILSILLTDLLKGIIVGMIVGFFFVIRSNVKKSVVMVNEGEQYLIRFHKDVSFLQKSILMKLLLEIPPDSQVVIDGSKSVFIDHDIEDLIEEFIKRARLNNITVELRKSPLALSLLFKE